jgi:hypothetical protein
VASDKLDKLAEFTTGQGIKLEYSDKIAPARGMSYGGLIRILPNMEPSETLATFVHELVHEMVHRAERRTLTTKTVGNPGRGRSRGLCRLSRSGT